MKLAKKHGVEIDITGIPALSRLIFRSKNNEKYKTFITQEMLKNKILATNTVYSCTEHNYKIIDQYIFYLDKIFAKIAECEDGRDIDELLKTELASKSFQRLN